MRIALIRYHDKGNINTRLPSSLNRIRGVLPPLGLAYIGSYLESKGHKVIIIDSMAENLNIKDTRKRIKDFSPQLVGVTAMTSSLKGALEAAEIAKSCDAKVVLGGPHLSAYPEETLSYDTVDFCIIGDGEFPMGELIDAILGKKEFRNVPGLVYRDSDKIINNGPFVEMNLDSLPYPAYHLLPLNKYSSVISSTPMTTVITARGCPYRCGFCFTQPTDRYYRMIKPAKVVDIMQALVNDYKIKEIMFYDDTITINREHIEGICLEIKKRNLKVRWESPCRVDTVDENLLRLMKHSGCFRLRFGVESGDPGTLKLMKKNTNLKQVEDVFYWCRKIRINTFAYFIIGYIDETEQTMQRTIDFSKKISPDFVMFTVATPYPFTDLYNLAEERGIIPGDYWRKFSLGQLSERIPYLVGDSEKWIKKAYKEFYFRPKYILRKILKARSSNDFRNMFSAAKGLLFFKLSN